MRSFFRNCRGNVAITFGIAVIPVLGAMGAAIDYSMANAQRTAMQSAADATVLALAKLMPLSQKQLDARGSELFYANLGTTPITGIKLKIVPTTGATAKIELTANGVYKPRMISVLGIGNFPVGTNAQAKWGTTKIEIALALDNTGSMAQLGKLAQLKIAAHSLLDTLQASVKTPGDVKVAIIPFGVQVRLDTTYRNAAWMKYLTSPLSQAGLTANQVMAAWQGCVTDRDQPNDVTDANPNNNPRRFPGVFNPGVDCGNLATAMFLSTDWNALHAKVDSLQAVGYTNVTMGAAWGWHALSPTMPFSGAAAYNTPNLQKFLILLTDGNNTQSRTDTAVAAIDARTALVCANAKAAGIKVFSVRVIDGNAALLQNCATNPGMYFDVQDASKLNGVFSSIASSIAQLHLAK